MSGDRQDSDQTRGDSVPPSVTRPDPTPAVVTTDPNAPRIPGYDILCLAGRGGMGVVWKAHHRPTNRLVALKVIGRADLSTEHALRRFQREADLVAQLEHPNIVRLYDSGRVGEESYFSMQYVDGPRLDHYVMHHRLSPRAIVALMRPVVDAVGYAHRRGVIHRDLKPGNILVSNDGTPHVLDFGLAKLAHAAPDPTLTIPGMTMGTPAYMSPEQAAGDDANIDTRTDIYSLGAILYHLCTGRLPHDLTGSPQANLRTILDCDPRPPRQINPRLSRDLEAIIMTAMDRDPARRYASATQFADDLRQLLDGNPVLARHPTVAYRVQKRIRKHPVASALVTALLIAALTIALISHFTVRSEREQLRLAVGESRRHFSASLDHLYLADMANAYRDWGEGRMAQVLTTLNRHMPRHDQPDRRDWEWYFLRSICRRDVATLYGHDGNVTCLAAAPDGDRVVTGGDDGTVRIWDLRVRKEQWRIVIGHGVRSVTWSPDGRWIAAAGYDDALRIWECDDDHAPQPALTDARFPVACAVWSADGRQLACGGRDGYVRILQTGQWNLLRHRRVSTAEDGGVATLAWSPDRSLIVTGTTVAPFSTRGQVIVMWNLESDDVSEISGHGGGVTSLSFTPDGSRLISGGFDNFVRVTDPRLKKEVYAVDLLANNVNAVALDADGRALAVATRNGIIHVRDSATGDALHALHGHQGAVRSVQWLNNRGLLASVSDDSTVKVWDPRQSASLAVSYTAHHLVSAVACDPTGDRVALATFSPVITVWNPADAQVQQWPSGVEHSIWTLAWHPDGKFLAAAGIDGVIGVVDGRSGQLVRRLTGHEQWIRALAWHPTKHVLASGSHDETVRIWDAEADAVPSVVEGQGGAVYCVAWSPDGSRLAAGTMDGTIRIIDPLNGTVLKSFRGHDESVHAVQWSHDGSRLASAGSDGVLKTWSADGKAELTRLPVMVGTINDLEWGEGDGRIALACDDGYVRICDPRTGRVYLALNLHTNTSQSIDWSRDGMRLVSGGFDRRVVVLDASKGYDVETRSRNQWWVSLDDPNRPDMDEAMRLAADDPVAFHAWLTGDGAWKAVVDDPNALRGLHADSAVGKWAYWSAVTFVHSPSPRAVVVDLNDAADGSIIVNGLADAPPFNRTTGGRVLSVDTRYLNLRPGWNVIWIRAPASPTQRLYWRLLDPETLKDAQDLTCSLQPTNKSFVRRQHSPTSAISADEQRTWLANHDMLRVFLAPDVPPRQAMRWFADTKGNTDTAPLDRHQYTRWNAHNGHVHCVRPSRDGRYVVSGAYDGTIRRWTIDQSNLPEPFMLAGPDGPSYAASAVTSLAVHPRGAFVVSAGNDMLLRLCDLTTGREIGTLQGHTAPVWSVALTGDGLRIASGGLDGTVRLWNVESMSPLWRAEADRAADELAKVFSVAVSISNDLVAAGDSLGRIYLLDTASGRRLHTMAGHEGDVASVAFSPDDTLLASASNDRTVRLWRLSDRSIVHTLIGHGDMVWTVAFSPDGKLLASAGADRVIMVWHVESGRLLATLFGHLDAVESVAFTPDGSRIISGSRDHAVHVWRLDEALLQGDR